MDQVVLPGYQIQKIGHWILSWSEHCVLPWIGFDYLNIPLRFGGHLILASFDTFRLEIFTRIVDTFVVWYLRLIDTFVVWLIPSGHTTVGDLYLIPNSQWPVWESIRTMSSYRYPRRSKEKQNRKSGILFLRIFPRSADWITFAPLFLSFVLLLLNFHSFRSLLPLQSNETELGKSDMIINGYNPKS